MERVRHLHRGDDTCLLEYAEPVGESVDHCNARTDYEMITHRYAPDKCDECQRIASLFTGCPRLTST